MRQSNRRWIAIALDRLASCRIALVLVHTAQQADAAMKVFIAARANHLWANLTCSKDRGVLDACSLPVADRPDHACAANTWRRLRD